MHTKLGQTGLNWPQPKLDTDYNPAWDKSSILSLFSAKNG